MNRMNFISNFKRKRKGAVRMATGKWLVVDTKYVGVWSRGSGASPWQVRWKVSKVPWWCPLLCPVGWRGGTYKVHFQDCSKMAANWEQDTLLHVYSFQNRKKGFSFSPSFAPGVSLTFADSLRMGIALKHIPRVGRYFFFAIKETVWNLYVWTSWGRFQLLLVSLNTHCRSTGPSRGTSSRNWEQTPS